MMQRRWNFTYSWCFDSALRASSPAVRNKIDE
jgi:hypothetical protein